MATQFVQDDRNDNTARTAATGSVLEAVAAAAAMALTIIGLAGAEPLFLAAIATIVLGAALLAEGGGVAARQHHYMTRADEHARTANVESAVEAGRTSAESIAGIAGIVLGILAVITVVPHVLLPIALIVFGGGLIMGTAGGMRRSIVGSGHEFVGVAAVVLGILSLIGVQPVTLVLVGLLAMGTAIFFFSATSWGARLLRPMRQHRAR